MAGDEPAAGEADAPVLERGRSLELFDPQGEKRGQARARQDADQPRRQDALEARPQQQQDRAGDAALQEPVHHLLDATQGVRRGGGAAKVKSARWLPASLRCARALEGRVRAGLHEETEGHRVLIFHASLPVFYSGCFLLVHVLLPKTNK